MKTAELQAVDLTWCGNDFYVENLLFLCAHKEKVAKRKCASQGRLPLMIRSKRQPVVGVPAMKASGFQTRAGARPCAPFIPHALLFGGEPK